MADELSQFLGALPDTQKGSNESVDAVLGPITLMRNDGQGTVQLTEERFEAWFNRVKEQAASGQENPAASTFLITAVLSRHGIITAHDLWEFLHSPAGESLIDLIEEDLAALASIQEYHEEEWREEQRQEMSLLAFLLLMFAYLKESKAEALNEYRQELINKILHHEKNEDWNKTPQEDIQEYLEDKYAALEEFDEYLDSKLEERAKELEGLEENRDAIEEALERAPALKVETDKNGTSYLIHKDKSLDDLSLDEKLEAKNKFQDEIANRDPSAGPEPSLNTETNKFKADLLDMRIDNVQAEMRTLNNQKLQIQGALAARQASPDMDSNAPIGGLPSTSRTASLNKTPTLAYTHAKNTALTPNPQSSRASFWQKMNEQREAKALEADIVSEMNTEEANLERADNEASGAEPYESPSPCKTRPF